jgi:hypothetical protein
VTPPIAAKVAPSPGGEGWGEGERFSLCIVMSESGDQASKALLNSNEKAVCRIKYYTGIRHRLTEEMGLAR